MTELAALLHRWDECWARAGVRLDEHLAAGAAADDVRARLAEAGLSAAPAEVVEWFGWHSCRCDPDTSPVDHQPAALEWALAERAGRLADAGRAAADMAPDDAPWNRAEHWFRPSWLPLASSGGGVVVAEIEPGAPTCRVFDVQWDRAGWDWNTPVAGSLGDALKQWIAQVDSGAWTFTPGRSRAEAAGLSIEVRTPRLL
ncbi:hypothetical protein ACIB24_04140 [Spongisporangium articulatum]|uniref:Knr4/Smi1-like domain-containing protein n=1 Tax=Spongisporangium articulatum TaxID=3362603 RepID=A0ABW8AIP8_9ACTN